jgi:hypothetical protein
MDEYIRKQSVCFLLPCSHTFVFRLFTNSLCISPQFDISTGLKIPSETFIKYANTEMLPFLYSQTEHQTEHQQSIARDAERDSR